MWKIKRIRIKNICTLKDIDYSFTQGVTTLVFGNNLDNDSQKSNGSGKSALTEAIVFGLTGSPLRQVKNDELINNDEENAFIGIRLENTVNKISVDIERTIYRKGSPDITVSMYRDGNLVDDGSTVKSGVDEYNKYILDLLGLSKDEIYNSYILSKHRYQDFLSASDKDKKEIINKFSNGNLVDQSIQAVQIDKKPLMEQFDNTKLELSNFEGRISATEEQIENEKKNAETRQITKSQRIQEVKDLIKSHQDLINEQKANIESYKSEQNTLNTVGDELNELDDKSQETAINEILGNINTILSKTNLVSYDSKSFNETREQLSDQIKLKNEEYEKLGQDIIQVESDLQSLSIDLTHHQEKFNSEKVTYDKFISDFEVKRQEYCVKREKLNEVIKSFRAKITKNNSTISDLEAKISGSIECPHCKKHFILGDKDFDIDNAKSLIKYHTDENNICISEIEKSVKDLECIDNYIDKSNKSKIVRCSLLETIEKDFKAAERAVTLKNEKLQDVKRQQSNIENIIKELKEKQTHLVNNMFDDIFNNITRCFTRLSNSIKSANESISNYNGIIEAKKELINKLETEDENSIISSLQSSLKEYKKKKAIVYKKSNDLDERIKLLNTQEARFIAFKTYLANSKVEALNDITNNFLEQIGSDLRVRFDGYTMLKSGKIRDKISVSLLRDGIDVGSFAKFSEGEKSRIQLATILAMNTLTNNNAEGDKGLDLLILDEILAAVDEEGLIHILDSLNKLKITSLVVSHGKTAESYPHKLVITKQNGNSTING